MQSTAMSEELISIPSKVVSLAEDQDWKDQQEIPEEDTNRTLIELGMETLNLKRIRGYKKIAKILKSVGMVEYERGCLVHREQSLAAAIDSITQLVLHDQNKDSKISAAHALSILMSTANKTAELNIRLEELARANQQGEKVGSSLPPAGASVAFIIDQRPEKVEKRANPTIMDVNGKEETT